MAFNLTNVKHVIRKEDLKKARLKKVEYQKVVMYTKTSLAPTHLKLPNLISDLTILVWQNKRKNMKKKITKIKWKNEFLLLRYR